MTTVRRVVGYVTRDSGELVRCWRGPLTVQEQPWDANSLVAAMRTLCTYLKLVQAEDREWLEGRQNLSPAGWCLSRFIAIYSCLLPNGDLFVPLPGQIPESTLDDMTDSLKSDLRQLYTLAVQSALYQGVLQNQADSLFALCDTLRPPDYAVLLMNEKIYNAGPLDCWYSGFFRNSGEVWTSYRPPFNQYPDESTLSSLKGIVITGSPVSLLEPPAWVTECQAWLRRVYYAHPHIRFVGVCFGAQILAVALGGQMGVSPYGQIVGYEEIQCTDEFRALYPQALPSYTLPQFHSDEISELPPEGRLYGSSPTCRVEIWGVPGRILSCQGHPNQTKDILPQQILPFLPSLITAEAYAWAEKTTREKTNQAEAFISLMRDFLSAS